MHYDPARQVNRGTWYVSTAETPDKRIVPLVLRSILPRELPLLLSIAGLELVSPDGDLAGTPFGPGSWMPLCVCRAR